MLKTKEVTGRLRELCEQRFDLGLNRVSAKSHVLLQRPPSTSLLTESSIYGRDEEKSNLFQMLLTNDAASASNLCVVSVLGMGGIGKTTLARHVFNEAEIENHFDVRAWVGVSDDFDVLRIPKVILDSIALSKYVLNDLKVQIQLKKVVTGKRLLLVLNDMWNDSYLLWETLKSPFLDVARGSKIMVTTRLEDVPLAVKPAQSYELKLLSDYDCWSLFVNHAFETSDFDAPPLNMDFLQKRVVEKCKGLPLATKTLGGLLRSKQTDDEWEDVMNSTLWEIPEESGILPVLLLSYYHLLPHLKRCFSYCASLVFIPESGFPNRNLRVLSMVRCMKLKALPSRMHSLHSLQTSELRQCPSIVSIQEQGFPTNLTSLAIADLNINKELIEWGFHKLPFLRNLDFRGCRYAVSFPLEERGMMLPTSLTRLTIARFLRLKYLSSKGFQNLTSLEYLSINDCPKFTSLPEPDLPSSLLQLVIFNCPMLKNCCKRDKGEEWFKIAHIPCVRVDGSFIYDRKVEDGA